MSRSEDATLLRAAQRGDRRARERVIARHLGSVRGLASRYRDLGLPFEDLVQEGSLGLLEAIDDFDGTRGDFERYLRFRVRRAIRNALTEKSRLIRLPKQIVERRRAIERTSATLTAANGLAPTTQELAAALDLPPALVVAALDAGEVPISLDRSVLPDGSTLETIVADESVPDPQSETLAHAEMRLVDAAVAQLPARQREIVTRHFGLGRAAEEISEVAAALHLSQQRTRAIEREALYTLRGRLDQAVTPAQREAAFAAPAAVDGAAPARADRRGRGPSPRARARRCVSPPRPRSRPHRGPA
jgi:RNA polymerase primary sigma factor